jgi:DnaJ-class molecular chaperone
MTLPPNYDAWRLQGPEEAPEIQMETCPECRGNCWIWEYGTAQGQPARRKTECPECEGSGEVEATLDEPDGDYEYERRRDAMEDRG